MTLDAMLKRLPAARSDSGTGIPFIRYRSDARAWHVRVRRHVGYFKSLTKAIAAAVAAYEGGR